MNIMNLLKGLNDLSKDFSLLVFSSRKYRNRCKNVNARIKSSVISTKVTTISAIIIADGDSFDSIRFYSVTTRYKIIENDIVLRIRNSPSARYLYIKVCLCLFK